MTRASRSANKTLLVWLLATVLTIGGLIFSTWSVHLITILQAYGVSLATAVALGALIGPAQVAARIVEMAIGDYHHPIWTLVASVSLIAMGLSLLWIGAAKLAVALLCYGAGSGICLLRVALCPWRCSALWLRGTDGSTRHAEPDGPIARSHSGRLTVRKRRRQRHARRPIWTGASYVVPVRITVALREAVDHNGSSVAMCPSWPDLQPSAAGTRRGFFPLLGSAQILVRRSELLAVGGETVDSLREGSRAVKSVPARCQAGLRARTNALMNLPSAICAISRLRASREKFLRMICRIDSCRLDLYLFKTAGRAWSGKRFLRVRRRCNLPTLRVGDGFPAGSRRVRRCRTRRNGHQVSAP